MTRHPFFAAPLLFAGAALLFIVTRPLPQQQVWHTPSRDKSEVFRWPSQGHSSKTSVFFAAAFRVPVASHVARYVSRGHLAVTPCEDGSLSNTTFSCPSRSSAAPARSHQQRQVGKQSIWTLRASGATPSPAAAPDLLLSVTPTTAVVTGVSGGALPALAMNRKAASFERPAAEAPLAVTLCALPNSNVAGEIISPAESMLLGTRAGAGSSTLEKDGHTTAAAATEGTQEKAPSIAAPLGPVVTRKDLVASLTAELQLPRADVERTVAALLRHITANLEVGRKVSISKFGTFNVRRRGERTARNPRTGDTLSVAAATFPTFSFSKVLKERVRDVVPINSQEENDEEIES